MDRLLTTLRRTQTSKVVAVVRAAGRGGGSWSFDLWRQER